jgi:ABC-2 type transport system ATP-binding protein
MRMILGLDRPTSGAALVKLAHEGRTLLLSPHLMSEMQLVANHLLIIGQGRILADTSMDDFIEHASGGVVVAASRDAGALAPLLAAAGVTLTSTEAGRFEVRDLTAE